MDNDTWMRILGIAGNPGAPTTGGPVSGGIATGQAPPTWGMGIPAPWHAPNVQTGQVDPTQSGMLQAWGSLQPSRPPLATSGMGLNMPGVPFGGNAGAPAPQPFTGFGPGSNLPQFDPTKIGGDTGFPGYYGPGGRYINYPTSGGASSGAVHPLIAQALQNLMRGSSFASLLGRGQFR